MLTLLITKTGIVVISLGTYCLMQFYAEVMLVRGMWISPISYSYFYLRLEMICLLPASCLSSSFLFSVVLFGAFVGIHFEMLLMSIVSSAYNMNLKASVALGMSFI